MTAKDTVSLKDLLCLLTVVCTHVADSQPSAFNCSGRFKKWPRDEYVPEGAGNATFRCFSPRSLSVAWQINGTSGNEIFRSATPPTAINQSTEILDGAAVNVLTIGALSEYNETLVTCEASFLSPNLEVCSANASLFILAPPGSVDGLKLHSTPTEVILTWKASSITANYTIQYCIAVYQTVGDMSMFVNSECIGNRTSYVFSVSEGVPDPSDLFQFIITPSYNVDGARNGTPTNISGYFTAGPPTLPQESLSVSVVIARDLLVTLNITVRNAESWITGGTRADEFLIKVVLHSGQTYECSPIPVLVIFNSTLSLHANCSGLPLQSRGTVTVTAVNSNGSSNLIGPISTYFIQRVRTQPCYSQSSHCQVKIMYDVVADPELVTGAFAFLNRGDSEIDYFDYYYYYSDNGAHSGVSVNGLSGDRYNMRVFSLNGTGLPFTFPANQSEVTLVAAAADGDHDTREIHLKGFKHTGGGCFQCQFVSTSFATHCAVIIHTLDKMVNVPLFERRGDSAEGCLTVEAGSYFAVAFGYRNNAIHGRPYSVEEEGTPVAVIVVVSVVVVFVVFVVVLVAGGVALFVRHYYLKNARRLEDTEMVPLGTPISPQKPSIQMDLGEKLRAVTSMEELLSYLRDASPDWTAIRDKLVALGRVELTEEVYKQYVLPKLKNQNEDSGRFTQTTSTAAGGDDRVEDDAPTEDSGEDWFEDSLAELGRSGVSSVIAHSDNPEVDPSASERAMHKQATDEADDGSDYIDNLRQQTLTVNPPEGSHPHHSTHQDEGAQAVPMDEGEQSDIFLFINQNSPD